MTFHKKREFKEKNFIIFLSTFLKNQIIFLSLREEWLKHCFSFENKQVNFFTECDHFKAISSSKLSLIWKLIVFYIFEFKWVRKTF
jgi:hypothetical protein